MSSFTILLMDSPFFHTFISKPNYPDFGLGGNSQRRAKRSGTRKWAR